MDITRRPRPVYLAAVYVLPDVIYRWFHLPLPLGGFSFFWCASSMRFGSSYGLSVLPRPQRARVADRLEALAES